MLLGHWSEKHGYTISTHVMIVQTNEPVALALTAN